MTVWVGEWRGFAKACVILGGVLVSLIGFSAASSPAFAQAVVVEGNRRVEADTIRSYFRPAPGQKLDAAKIDEGLKALYATGLFQDVRLNQSGGRLVITVVEAPVINRIAFEGNKRVKDEQLSGEIQSKARGSLSRPTVQADVQRLVEMYRRSGRFDVRIEPKIIELPNNRVDLVFEVSEGPKTGVKSIEFIGNRAYSGYRLRDVIKTGQSNILSFLKNNDIYDPDRVEADRDLLRRFYLKNGYADVRIVSAVSQYDPERKGFVVTFTIDEGEQYRFGTVEIVSNVRDIPADALRARMRTSAGSIYNAEAVEKSVEAMTIEIAKRGYAFGQVRPRGDRNFETRQVNLVYVIEEGPRAYIERINVRGNTRTRDYVIRREFDLGEGDAYNRALVDRAERRLKNLGYFKTVKITNEPGSAPDRIVLNVDVEEQSTGEFSVAGGYSTADGLMAEVSVAERNLLGRGQYAKASVQYGTRARGFELSFAEPYFLDYRLMAGIDVFAREVFASSYLSYDSQTVGTALRLGIPLREDMSLGLRYSIYQQEITLPANLRDCTPATLPTAVPPPATPCTANGEASIPVKLAADAGAQIVSLVGYSLTYNTLDNNKNPHSGLFSEIKQDFAGVGGDVNFIRTTTENRFYYELYPDIVGLLRAQAGYITSWGGRELRMLDHFSGGPNLVRGFASYGMGPRDTTSTTLDPLGGSIYWATTAEVQSPIWGLPSDFGMKAAVFVDAGSLWDYRGPTFYAPTGQTIVPADSSKLRASAGVGLIWDSPFGPIRFDYAIPFSKETYDRVQEFRFSGGTRF